MSKKKLDLKDMVLLTRRASRDLQISLIPIPKSGPTAMPDYVRALRSQISWAEEFIFQAKRYMRKASKP